MTWHDTRTRLPLSGARLVLIGSSLVAFSLLTSALYAVYYALGEAFPAGGVPVPVFAVVSLAAVAVLGLLAVGFGMAMDAFSPTTETPAPSVDAEDLETRQAA